MTSSRSTLEIVTRVIGAVAIVFAAATILRAAWGDDWTWDEQGHLTWSREFWVGHSLPRDNSFGSKTPMWGQLAVERLAPWVGLGGTVGSRFAPRFVTGLYFLALCLAVYAFTALYGGKGAAWAATLGVLLDPNLLAHSALVTVDVPFALASFLVVWAMVRFVTVKSLGSAAWMGATAGFACVTKFSGMFLLPMILLVSVFPGKGERRGFFKERERRGKGLACTSLAFCFVICAFYLFRDVGETLESQRFQSGLFRSLSGAFGWLRVPLPREFLAGVDGSLACERNFRFNSVLFGSLHHGVWYYFVALWLMKTPLALLGATAFGLVRFAKRLGRAQDRAIGILALQAAIYLGYFSFGFRTQIGYRFVLMVLPLVYSAGAIGLSSFVTSARGRCLAIAVLILSLAETVPYFGQQLSFTNSLVLPKREAYRYIANSNLNWRQHHERIGDLIKARNLKAWLDPPHILPGLNIFDTNAFSGVLWNFEQHRWARQYLLPKDHLEHTHLLFSVSDEEFYRFLNDERRLSPLTGSDLCRGAPPESERFLELPLRPSRQIVCVHALNLADIAITAKTGRFEVGPSRDGRCTADKIHVGQEVWYRLEPGTHELCLHAEEAASALFQARVGSASFVIGGGERLTAKSD